MLRTHEVAALANAQMQKGALRKKAYEGRDFYFSRKTIPVDTLFPGQLTFFNDVANQNGILTSQTNLQAAGQTSNLDSFLLMGVRFGWSYGACAADVSYLINNLNLVWRFFNVEFFQGPPEGYPGGSAAYATAASSLALTPESTSTRSKARSRIAVGRFERTCLPLRETHVSFCSQASSIALTSSSV